MLAVVLVIGGYFTVAETQIVAQVTNRDSAQSQEITAEAMTVPIQSASSIVGAVSASGQIELVSQHYVALDTSGEVKTIAVDVGDLVQAGDLLLSLDAAALERAVTQAELDVDTASNALAQLTEAADAAEIAAAQANLLEAQENLADVLAGPSAEEIAAAQSSLSSAWATYNELLDGPSEAELTQLSADLKKAEVTLAEAQQAYDAVAWQNNVGMTAEASDLQEATIDYESALAAYEEATAPAATSEVDAALSAAQSAQSQLDELQNSPTSAEIAAAESTVADAEATLNDLLVGASESELRDAEINLEQALVNLQSAYADLDAAQVVAPVDGTVLAIDAELGEQLSEGTTVVTLADTTQLQLTIDVAEVDIVQVSVGQAAEVEIDALPNQVFAGVVEYIAPSSDDADGVISYPVTIRLTDDDLDGVRPDMSAVATITDTNATTSDSWLVPTNAIQQQGDTAIVMVVREDGTTPVEVLTGTVQGEWTVVQSPELSAGDEVIGSVTSYIDEDTDFGGPGGDGGNAPAGAGLGAPVR